MDSHGAVVHSGDAGEVFANLFGLSLEKDSQIDGFLGAVLCLFHDEGAAESRFAQDAVKLGVAVRALHVGCGADSSQIRFVLCHNCFSFLVNKIKYDMKHYF